MSDRSTSSGRVLKIKIIFGVISTTAILICYLKSYDKVHQKPKKFTTNGLCKEENAAHTSGKIILYWTKYFDTDDFYIGYGTKPFEQCSNFTSSCITTNDRSLLDHSDAVIFHIRDLDVADMPLRRLPNQRWIFFLLESPLHTPNILHNLGNVFNWTMTYRTDSDIYAPYPVIEVNGTDQGIYAHKEHSVQNQIVWNLVKHKKKKLIAWFASNCYTESGREKYISEIQKYVDVDIYGTCGSMKCLDRLDCYKMMERDYKFYIAFENSICRDYVTEKFYNTLLFNTVPIVYSGANFSAIAPKGSYINIHDFPTVRDLAQYLKFLDKNYTAYLKYFDWRKSSSSPFSFPRLFTPWCKLCKMLHDSKLPTSSYKNIHSWWFDQSQCGKEGINLRELVN